MMPRSSMTIMASGMVSRIDLHAPRQPLPAALAAAERRERRNKSPRHDAPAPTKVKTVALMMSALVKIREPVTKNRPSNKPRMVAAIPAPIRQTPKRPEWQEKRKYQRPGRRAPTEALPG